MAKAGLPRRNFLIRSCQWAAATILHPRLGRGAPLADADFHLHPLYRTPNPLDALTVKANAAFDNFPAEQFHDRVAPILAAWSADLLESPGNLGSIAAVLSRNFHGTPFEPVQTKAVRPGRMLHVNRVAFSPTRSAGQTAFLDALRNSLSSFSRILTAEFQITGIDEQRTRVRYEIVGTGSEFYREQRVGFWELDWVDGRIRSWTSDDETRSRSTGPIFTDTTAAAFRDASSYPAQLLHGVDYWRTVLDGACGIDIYGHNGVSVGDIDGDGFDDLYVCQPAGLPNRLYRNRRDGTFEDITETSGVGLLDNTACALFADFNNNGLQDLVVVRANGPLMFLNQGDGKFQLKPGAFQFATPPQGTFTGAATADYDGDGWLDIYFCLYVYYQGTDQYKYPTPYYDAENGPPNFLMRNNRDGTFRDVTAASGLDKNNTRFSFCCGWNDYNGDGSPDLYVVNDFGRKNLYRNNGDGTFTDVAPQAGVEDVGAGMSVCWLDYDNDGLEDLYASDMWTAAGERIAGQAGFKSASPSAVRALYQKHATGNSLFHANTAHTFQDATVAAGVGMGRWSWSSDSWDFDHDGFPDLYIANGMLSGPIREDLNSFFWRQVVANSPDEAKSSYDYEQGWSAVNELIRADHTWSGFERNVFYANNRDGTFSDVSGVTGMDFLEDGRSFALADFDHDGRQEVFLKNRNGPQLRLLKNVMDELPPSIAFRLHGTRSNRDAIGAVVTVQADVGRQIQSLQAGSGFLSQHSKEVFFGLGDAKGPVKASVRWPSGLVQEFRDVPINHRIWIEEGSEQLRVEPFVVTVKTTAASQPDIRPLPDTAETWLLAPVAAPLLAGFAGQPALFTIKSDDEKPADTAAIYNILYRYLFDRHRDLSLPTSFLIDAQGDIVKVYQGAVNPKTVEDDLRHIPRTTAERLAKALPFPGVSETYEFGRNHLSYGSVFFQRGYFDQAKASFSRALREDPTSAEAYYGLGSVALNQGEIPAARAAFEQAVKLKAGYPDTLANAWNNLGLLATREGRTDEAIRCLKEALRQNPEHFIALENLGNAYRQQKDWEKARETLERVVSMRPQDAEANYSLAMVFAQTDDSVRANDYLERALKIRPTYPEALNNLGVLYLRTRRPDDAVAKFEECIRVAPGFDQSYLNVARVYSIEGATEKARAVLLELLKEHPDHVQARRALEQLP